MWNDCGNALVITTCAMRHAILTAEKNVWIQWISEQPGKNNNFGQLAYVKPFAPYRLCLTNGGPYQRLTGPSIIRRLSTWKLSTGYNILTTSTALRQEGNNLSGGRLEWRTSFFWRLKCVPLRDSNFQLTMTEFSSWKLLSLRGTHLSHQKWEWGSSLQSPIYHPNVDSKQNRCPLT